MTVELFRRRAAALITDVRNVVLVTAAFAVLGAVAAVAAVAALPAPYPDVAGSTLAMFGLSLAIAATPVVRLKLGAERSSVDLFEAILVPAIFALEPVVLVPLVAAAVGTSNIVLRNAPLKAIFNAVQWAAAAAVGSLVYVLSGPSQTLTGRTIIALAAATIMASLVNDVAVDTVVRVNASGRPPPESPPPLTRLYERVTGWTFNAAFGILFVTAYVWEPIGLLLVVAPLLVLGTAYRQYASARSERIRFEGVRRALHALEGRPGLEAFVEDVRESFTAETVDLYVRENGSIIRYHADAVRGGVQRETQPDTDDAHGAALLATVRRPGPIPASLGWGDAIAAPLYDGRRLLGALVVAERSGLDGFDEAEVTLLEALAAEVASRAVSNALAQAVVRERRRLRDIVDRSSDAGFALDRSGAIVVWNEAMERITGFSRADVIGLALPASLGIRDEHDRIVPLGWWSDDEVALPPEICLSTKGGERRWLSCVYTRVPGDEDGPVMLMVVARDITEPREASKIGEVFAGTVAHELRTPLTPIRGWAETLAAHDHRLKRSERRAIAQRIATQAEHLEILISRLLEVARAEHPGMRAGRADLIDVVEQIVDEHRLASPGRAIELSVGDADLKVHGDPLWIGRIVSNLVGNAVKYSPPLAPVEVTLCPGSGGCIHVEVSDRGPGIPWEQRHEIFDLYARLEHAARPEGTGLGLYISRQLASALGAELTVEDRDGGGSTFILALRPAGTAT